MKENSREEDIILLKDFTEGNFKRDKLENYKGSYKMGYFYYKDIQQALEHILSDYKRVLKENEELKEDRKNNNEMIAFAQNELLNYMSGYEEGKKHKMTAVAQVVENQQYYIVRKQMEKYEEHIKRLQKENEELKENRKNINEILNYKSDEMLKNLGYEKVSDENYSFEYRKILDEDLFEINFWKEDKTISKNHYRNTGYITIKELQAINKKCQELGWLKED